MHSSVEKTKPLQYFWENLNVSQLCQKNTKDTIIVDFAIFVPGCTILRTTMRSDIMSVTSQFQRKVGRHGASRIGYTPEAGSL